MTALLSVEGLVVEYGRGARVVRALDGLDLALAAGETLGVVGESGSGKSTLARAVVALTAPAAGRVCVDGQDLARLAPKALSALRRDVQIVFQNPTASLSPRRTVAESIGEPLTTHEPRLGAHATRARVMAMLERVGLDPRVAERRPHALSGGQCQRVAIARAMILRPRLVVLDEPVSALDVSVQAQVLNLLLDLQREQGVSYLFISHDLAVIRRMAPRVLVLYRGRCVEEGERAALFAHPAHPYTRLLLDSVPAVEAADHYAAAATVPPENASPFERLPGCGFVARCGHAQTRCAASPPVTEAVSPSQQVACWRWREGVAGSRLGS